MPTKDSCFEQVHLFLSSFGSVWSSYINKNIEVFEFEDSEIVSYGALDESSENQILHCFEIEAKNYQSFENAKDILNKYQEKLYYHLLCGHIEVYYS